MKKLLLIGCLMLTSLFSAEFESELTKNIKELKQIMPYKITEYAIWENIERKGDLIEYTFILKNKEFKGFTKSEIEGIIKKQCNNKTTKLILSNDYTLKLNYKDYNEVIVQDFTIDKSNCGYKN